jgi:hypothetical protein
MISDLVRAVGCSDRQQLCGLQDDLEIDDHSRPDGGELKSCPIFLLPWPSTDVKAPPNAGRSERHPATQASANCFGHPVVSGTGSASGPPSEFAHLKLHLPHFVTWLRTLLERAIRERVQTAYLNDGRVPLTKECR